MNHFYLKHVCKKREGIKLGGFTLVEMLVVLGLFSFIMTLATGALYSTQAINVKLQDTQSVLDNVNLSMETMSRDIRYGFDFHCAEEMNETDIQLRKSCSYQNTGASHGGKFLFFRPFDAASSSDRVVYYASTTSKGSVILKDEYIADALGNISTTTYQITTSNVKIKSLIFYVTGANTTLGKSGMDVGDVHDYAQPLITINISGETIPIKQNASSTKFIIQSSVTSRNLDN